MSNKEITANFNQAFSQVLYCFKHKQCSMYTCLAIYFKLLNAVIVEPWIEAVDRDHFQMNYILLFDNPIEDRIIMNTEVVSEPQDDSVFLRGIKRGLFEILQRWHCFRILWVVCRKSLTLFFLLVGH